METKLALRVEEAAILLQVSRAQAYELVRRNQIPHMKVGDRIRIPRLDLERWLSEQAQANLAA